MEDNTNTNYNDGPHTTTTTNQHHGQRRSLLLIHDVLQASLYLRRLQRGEPELGAPRLQRRDDLVHVVADHAETGVFCVLLDD